MSNSTGWPNAAASSVNLEQVLPMGQLWWTVPYAPQHPNAPQVVALNVVIPAVH